MNLPDKHNGVVFNGHVSISGDCPNFESSLRKLIVAQPLKKLPPIMNPRD
jgi:hypothetical protein